MQCVCSYVPSHTSILPIRVWAVPYAYGLSHTRMGSPYVYGQPVRVWAARTHMGCPYAHGSSHTDTAGNPWFTHMRMSARMRISMTEPLAERIA